MAFDGRKKQSDPTYQQLTNVTLIDNSFNDLASLLIFISKNHKDMKIIIANIEMSINQAKAWVLVN